MKRRTAVPGNIDEYIDAFPPRVRTILNKIRKTVAAAAPDADEKISYRMPAFAQDGILIYFAAFTHHIGVFPPVSGDPALERSLLRYRGPKGNLKFPLDEPMPYALISRIVKLHLRKNRAKTRKARGRQKD